MSGGGFGGGWGGGNGGGHEDDSSDFSWVLDVDYTFVLDATVTFDTTVNYDSNYNVDPSVDICVEIEGNWAGFAADVQAVGEDTAVELNVAVVTVEDEYSSITMTGYSAVA